MKQKPLFCGLDCEPGQLDLFQTDGPAAEADSLEIQTAPPDDNSSPELQKRTDGWWILGFECGPVGPYETKAEATDDQRGLTRFYEENPDL